MPRYPKRNVSDGWQIAERATGFYLQRQTPGGTWFDVAGPYKQRGSAYARWRRETVHRTSTQAAV